ncbi:MAG TPA: L-fucose:H+ symporter permease [Bacteroidales bacterium]|jgi:FHS family L-fucose permease-like MFS transporter|nr:L-fucose:H+ symporter permease [Bacteroidales bacterium]
MTKAKLTTKEFMLPFIMITSLFFLWGLAHGMVDTLDKHFQQILHLHKWQSSFIQFSLYGAYFTMALPAGYFMRKFGYKKGIIFGLSLFALGAFMIAGTTSFESFWVFLICLFILGCGLATLETAANPYTTKLGPGESAEQRINFSQSFNGLAWVIGPLIALSIYGNQSHVEGEKMVSLILPLGIIGLVVMTVALVFIRLPLPEISEEDAAIAHGAHVSGVEEKPSFFIPLVKQPHFVMGVIAQFCYVAAQTGVFSYLINFVTDEGQYPRFDVQYAPYFLSIGFALFMIGRLSGSYLMGIAKPTRILAIYAALCCLLLPVVSARLGWVSVISLYGVFFFMSIMFPTIFALGIKDLGPKTKKASSFLVMAVVGGAIFPPLMGYISDIHGMSTGFLVPIPLFLFILFYALKGHKVKA